MRWRRRQRQRRESEWYIVRMVNVRLNINTFGRMKCIALKLKHVAEPPVSPLRTKWNVRVNESDESEQTTTNIFYSNILGSFAGLIYTYVHKTHLFSLEKESMRESYCVDLGYPVRKISVIYIFCLEINAFDNNVKSMPFQPKCLRD